VTDQAANAAVDQACRILRLPTIRSRFGEIADAAEREQLTYRGFLAELLMTECDDRGRRRSDRQIKAAGFPRAKWLADFEGVAPTAVEEIVRWATPVIHFRRTVTTDVEMGGARLRAGDKVVIWYNSANRDERTFTDPYRFDVTRSPNEHVGFGGGGAHYCLGANLARREIKTMFEEIFRTCPGMHVVGAPDMLFSGFIHGIKRMRVQW
jgi:cytochrome P450